MFLGRQEHDFDSRLTLQNISVQSVQAQQQCLRYPHGEQGACVRVASRAEEGLFLGRKKWLTGSSLGVGTHLVDGNIPQGNKGCCEMCLCSPLCCEDITLDSYILTTLTNHQLLHNFHSVVHPIQAMEAVTICRETFASAFITDWYLKSESLNFNTTCVTMVAKFLYYMSLWRWTLEIIINLLFFLNGFLINLIFFGDVFDGGY